MGAFLAIGVIGVVVLLVSLFLGDFVGEADFLDSGDHLPVAAIAGFAAAFGLTGALMMEPLGGLLASGAGVVAGTGVAALTGWFTQVLRRQQSAPAPGRDALMGVQGTVVSDVPSDGYGEVALVIAGHRSKVNARSLEPIPVGTKVTVVAVHSPTAVQVEPVRGRTALP